MGSILVGRCTTHFRLYFSGDWDVHWGYGLLTHGPLAGRSECSSWRALKLAQFHLGRSLAEVFGSLGSLDGLDGVDLDGDRFAQMCLRP